jgi:hypothetical protein
MTSNEKNTQVLKDGEILIPTKELEEETEIFKQWSGSFLIKLFGISNESIFSLGSGGLLKYKGRYFAVTNEHVVRPVEKSKRLTKIGILYNYRSDSKYHSKRATIIAEAESKDNDLAAFEISPETVEHMNDHSFLDETFFEEDIKGYFDNTSNIIFTHGYPSTGTDIDHLNKVIDMETLPYTTFIESYDYSADILMLHAEEGGNKVPTFYGMSGSLIYGYYRSGILPYKCFGILSFWETGTERLGVFPITDITRFLDQNFFNNEPKGE